MLVDSFSSPDSAARGSEPLSRTRTMADAELERRALEISCEEERIRRLAERRPGLRCGHAAVELPPPMQKKENTQ